MPIGFSFQEKKRSRFSRWLPWWPSWISDRNNFSNFFIYKTPRCFLPSLESIGLLVQVKKKRKIDFHDVGHLGFLIGTILATFDLQVTPMLSNKFQVNWPFSSGEAAKNVF